ncbi:MAG: hypothetical protein V1881_00890, partial [Candidatus Micrarchaeota archaeon]
MAPKFFTESILRKAKMGADEINYLSRLSLPAWYKLIAEAAVESDGNASLYPARWRERNADRLDIG